MKRKSKLKTIGNIIVDAAKNFGNYKIPKLSASLAYYTVFALAPLLVSLMAIGGLLYSHDRVQGKVLATMSDFLGSATANELLTIVEKASLQDKSRGAAVFGGFMLLVAASAVFKEIQDSLNYIWRVKARPRRGWWRFIQTRLLSFSVVIGLGFLLMVSLTISTLLDTLGARLGTMFPDVKVGLLYALNLIITLGIVTFIFAVIFQVLPDTKTPLREVWGGAFITGILFMLGKFAISVYISRANIGSTYGAAGSLVILLLWVYYSSFILYFGSAITKHWVMTLGSGIHPDKDAAIIKEVETQKGKLYRE